MIGLKKPVYADAQTQNADFEIQPVMPSEQVDQSLNYFDVKYAPGTTHVIKMRIQNYTDHNITVKSDLQNGITQTGGDMKFQKSTAGLDSSLKTPLTSIAKLEKAAEVIKLGPNKATIVSATIKMPTEKQKGLIAGGWHFIEYVKGGNAKSQSVSSNYAYMISIDLRGSHYKVYPELKYASTKPMLHNGHPALGIKLRNVQPMVIKKASYKAVVYKEGLFQNKRVYQKTNSSIAPNSSVTLPINWDYDTLKPGKYHVDVKVTGQNLWNSLPMTWTFKKVIMVKKDAVKTINAQSLKKPVNGWVYAATASGVLLLVSLVGLYKVIRIGR